MEAFFVNLPKRPFPGTAMHEGGGKIAAPRHVAGQSEDVCPVAGKRAAVSEAPLAQVVQADVEIGARRPLAETYHPLAAARV